MPPRTVAVVTDVVLLRNYMRFLVSKEVAVVSPKSAEIGRLLPPKQRKQRHCFD